MIGAVQVIQFKNSLFTEAERKEFITKERSLVADAKNGIVHPLIGFWEGKRNLMIQRATERGIPFIKVQA